LDTDENNFAIVFITELEPISKLQQKVNAALQSK